MQNPEFSLFSLFSKNLDPHLTFPLLEFMADRNIYPKDNLNREFLNIVKKTNLIDYIVDIRKRLNMGSEIPEELSQKRALVLATLQDLNVESEPITKVIGLMNDSDNIKDSATFISKLEKDHGYTPEWIDISYKIGKYLYDCGRYDSSISYLYFCLVVMQPSDKNYLNVLWGLLAGAILTLNWESALEYLSRLREYIDNSNFTTVQALQQRTWLIHWGVFVFVHHPKGPDCIIEMCLYKPLYLNTIQTMCPHILRYLAVAVIITPGRRNALKDLIKVIQQESYTYRDPITEFLEHLYVNFDFEGARSKLHECQTKLNHDFFFLQWLPEFIESARLMIFETFCRIHQCITIGMLADKLNMEPNAAECWIVNLIRNARLDAKIDSKLGHVIMGTQPLSPYQQLIEKIDSLSVRSEALTSLVERKHKAKNTGQADNWKYYNSDI